jgi:hypothetical protein
MRVDYPRTGGFSTRRKAAEVAVTLAKNPDELVKDLVEIDREIDNGRTGLARSCSFSAPRKQGGDILLDVFGLGGRSVATHDLAVLADQELGEVPLDAFSSEHAGLFGLQVFEEWVGLITVHLDLGKHRKAHFVSE